MNNLTFCPNCGAKIKDGVFGSNSLMSDIKSELIAEVNNTPKITGCGKCLYDTYEQAFIKFMENRKNLQDEILEQIKNIPVITMHCPFNWDYKILGLATGQSTTGTGLFTEVGASWTDFFGMQSQAYNKKIAGGEELCLQQIRSKAIRMGGNAVIAVDIDYSEMGGEKGMIMVCMSGTVIKLNNLEVLEQHKIDSLKTISLLTNKLQISNNKYAEILEKFN
ncbi:heavy metal-binding domain-containing protein [Chitinophaga oryzae]|uniref:Heavy metal-binding domain-containing protein n=1 Tax=Chitinophaga oryzae TaxID=2725414 RepID=A0AAE7D824_9BACT|nr:heavy metal-binding domain-containing protein [Chitinophaga oryzae]QJB32309.1 heavy metal-binding domain-containing protein [Chitinophaga oryzae]